MVLDPTMYSTVDKAFTIYLPNGQVSTNVFDPTKSIRELINRLTSTRAQLLNDSYSTTDLQGHELPLSMTQAEITGHKICYGTDILEW